MTPGDRADLIIGSLAAHSAGSPPIAGVLLTLDEKPGPDILALAARLAPGTPVLAVPTGSFPTAAELFGLDGKLGAGTPRKAETALGLFETHVDTAELTERLSVARSARVTPMMFEHALLERARAAKRRIVLPEGAEERILRAAEVLLRRGVCDLTLLGEEDAVRKKAGDLGIGLDDPALAIVDPQTSPLRDRFAALYAKLRAHKGVTLRAGVRRGRGRVVLRHADGPGGPGRRHGLGRGALHGGHHPAGLRDHQDPAGRGDRLVGVLHVPGRPGAGLRRLRGQPGPGRRAARGHRDPGGGHRGPLRRASRGSRCCRTPPAPPAPAPTSTRCARPPTWSAQQRPDLLVEGPIQYDAAVAPSVAATKLPGSAVAGQATVLIFPDLNTGNNTYKAVQRSAGAVAVGPVLQGLRKPVNDLSRGALVQDIVNTVAITAIQAQGDDRR